VDTVINFRRGKQWVLSIAAICLVAALLPACAQKQPASSSAEKTRQVLAANARALDSRGRPDMAIQIWQQILLSDPNNSEALAGLARDYKLSGSSDKSDQMLEKLRAVNPNDPNIARIQGMSTNKSQSDELRRAGDLARQGRNADAMRIYRQIYGDHPP
jgi:cellulose synthase operon protein C